MVILKATMREIRDLMMWRPVHDRSAGTKRCMVHAPIDLRNRPVESCTRCALDLRDFTIDSLKAASQVNLFHQRMRQVLSSAQDAGTA